MSISIYSSFSAVDKADDETGEFLGTLGGDEMPDVRSRSALLRAGLAVVECRSARAAMWALRKSGVRPEDFIGCFAERIQALAASLLIRK
jgi:hypothetical protein